MHLIVTGRTNELLAQIVDQQKHIIELLSQLVQKSSKITEITDPASIITVASKQMVVMPEISQPTVTLQSTPTLLPSSSLQEDTTYDDCNSMNSPSWISLLSEKSAGDPESNSEQNSSDMLLPPLYDLSSYLSAPAQPSEVSQPPSTVGHSLIYASTPTVTLSSMNPQVTAQQFHPTSCIPQQSTSAQNYAIPPPPFSTPPKLHAIEEVMRVIPGTDIASLRRLATAVAREVILGKKELQHSSLSGKKRTGSLDKSKLDYIKSILKSRVPNMRVLEYYWSWSGQSADHHCQSLAKL